MATDDFKNLGFQEPTQPLGKPEGREGGVKGELRY